MSLDLYKFIDDNSRSMIWAAIVITVCSLPVLIFYSRRANKRFTRLCYFCFLPGWVLLGFSIELGWQIQSGFVTLRSEQAKVPVVVSTFSAMQRSYAYQQLSFYAGLITFAIWLVMYCVYFLRKAPGN